MKKFLRNELLKCNFINDEDEDYFIARDLKARIVFINHPEMLSDNPPSYINVKKLVIQFAVRSTFDRWANSVDFEIDYQHVNPDFVNLKKSLKFIRHIIRANIFNFNSYFHKIQIDP